MKCTSCVSSQPRSDDDDEVIASSTRTMNKIEEEYRVESPPTLPERALTSRGPPSVSIIEVPPDYRGESSRVYDIALDKQHSPSPSSSSHHQRPLDVIAEESSDVSDSENRPSPPKPDLCFPRPKARFKKAKSRNLLKTLLQPKQEQTTCVLVDAKIAESAPEEYRSVCTTEVVPEEILEVEVIDLGSNSSSLADLTDIEDLDEDQSPVSESQPAPNDVVEVQRDQDKINNNGKIDSGGANEFRKTSSPPPPNRDDNDNEIDFQSDATTSETVEIGTVAEIEEEQEQVYSEEDNNHYADDDDDVGGNNRESRIFTQPHAVMQNDDDDDGDDTSDSHENDRNKSDWEYDDERTGTSLLAGVDRAGVVTQHRNVIEVKECIATTEGDKNDSIDCCVTHRPSSSDTIEDRPVIGDSGGVHPKTIEMTEETEQVPKPPPIPLRPPPPPPSAIAAPTATAVTVEPLPPPAVTNLGRDVVNEDLESATSDGSTVACENGQIHSGSDTGEADYSNADQNSAQDSVDAVAVERAADDSESSVLLKFLQDSQRPPPSAEASVENRPTFVEKQQQNLPAVTTKIERAVKSDQLNYEIVQDHRVLREETVTTATRTASSSSSTATTGEVLLRRRGSQPSESQAKEHSPEQRAALVHDLRNEISRIKDAELQEEFRKLELEAARIEEELGQMATMMPKMAHATAPPPSTENLTYYVSKQNDFAVERTAAPRNKPPPPVAAAPKPSSNSVAKSSSNDQLYSEWQQKMEERETRRLHKVINVTKTSNEPSSEPIPLPPPPQTTSTPPEDPTLEDEYLRKVKDRRRKFTIPGSDGGSSDYDDSPSAPNSTPATPIASRKPIPKHIEAEFANFAEIRKRQQDEEKKEEELRKRQQQHNDVDDAMNNMKNKAAESHQQQLQHRSRQTVNQTKSIFHQPPAATNGSNNNTTSSVASSVALNGGTAEESVKVSALIEVHQQKQRELIRQDSYKAAVRSVASSAENLSKLEAKEEEEPPAPVSVSAKCQEFERRLQRSASCDGRKPDASKQPQQNGSSSLKICASAAGQPGVKHAATGGGSTAADGRSRIGVWSPHNRSTEVLTKAELAERSKPGSNGEAVQPVWTPRSAPPSPVSERREFRPIGFESPTPTRRILQPPSSRAETPQVPAPWTTSSGYERPVEFSSTPPTAARPSAEGPPPPSAEGLRRHQHPLQTSSSLPTIGPRDGCVTPTHTVRFAPHSKPAAAAPASPTINTILKNKDGKVSQQVSAFESATGHQQQQQQQSNVYQTSTSRTTVTQQQQQQHQYQRSSSGTRLGGRTSEISTPIKVEYLSEPESSDNTRWTVMAQLSPKKHDGIGPTTREGMPLTLRSEVDEINQAKWYKKMYQTLHKARNDGNFPYKTSGYQSEPEPNYDSDYTIKYSTLDRRRTPLNPNNYSKFNTLQGSAIRSGTQQYRNQPGRIENYTPGRSSISEKESKEWWDEVMDIFNGQLEQQKLSTSKTYTEGNLSRALSKEQGGYDSDTTLIFRKKEVPTSAALSPIEQKQYYKNMQAGGEIPVQGFRKPAPEKPKEFSNVPPAPPMKGTPLPNSSSPYSKSSNEPEFPRRYIESDVNIHYKTPIRYEYKEAIPDDELAYRQAEHMRRVYQEERRRKYMHELEDLHNRRHTDNFTPSQKSPIPLNRYEDFEADLSPKPVAPSVLPRTIARALYNFQGQSARELTFKKGDIIYLRRQIDKNWYEGEHNAMIGLLPANYIEILPREGAKPLPKKPQREGKARAKFNFTAQTSVELSLLKGELVTLTRRVDDNWFEGRIGNKKGIFPVSYVEVLTDIGGEESYEIEPIVKPSLQTIQSHTLTTGFDSSLTNGRVSPGIIRETKTVQKTEVLHVDTTNEPISYRALYNYKPQNSDELELLEGDVVYVLEKCDDGWYVGTSARTGCFGTFPGNYVKKL
ncbi:uncharacterized protein CAP isoform X8 [Ochlerotatus camptorhynchus]|uniref:uncharacterized protein CAP isoform X8 n=1 Tax=Ochlerotatus camptorhynchus TaxID=644619 RepID=UPI0031E3E72A